MAAGREFDAAMPVGAVSNAADSAENVSLSAFCMVAFSCPIGRKSCATTGTPSARLSDSAERLFVLGSNLPQADREDLADPLFQVVAREVPERPARDIEDFGRASRVIGH